MAPPFVVVLPAEKMRYGKFQPRSERLGRPDVVD
jgi:hypothetical protein